MKPLANPVLRSAFSDAGIKLLDIGAGGKPKRQMSALAPVSHLFACEPGPERAEEIAALPREGDRWRELTVIREAMASTEGVATLYETAKPGWSSLLRPDPRVCSQYLPNGSYTVVAETSVPTISLDSAAVRYGFEDACFLKIDTQGTELDILRSGARLLDRSVVGVYLEANFKPFYRNQSLFSDTDPFLRRHGFRLLELRRAMLRPRGFREDMYSRRHPVWAHCFYLRDPQDLAARPETEAVLLLLRYLALSLVYVHFDLALEVVSQGKPSDLLAAARGPELVDAVDAFVRQQTRRYLRGKSNEEKRVLLDHFERQ